MAMASQPTFGTGLSPPNIHKKMGDEQPDKVGLSSDPESAFSPHIFLSCCLLLPAPLLFQPKGRGPRADGRGEPDFTTRLPKARLPKIRSGWRHVVFYRHAVAVLETGKVYVRRGRRRYRYQVMQ